MVYLRITLSILLGLLSGGMVNGSFIHLGSKVFPYPSNFSMDLFYTLPLKYYLFPFLAHALGTLSGCLVYLRIAAKQACVSSAAKLHGAMQVHGPNHPKDKSWS